MRGVGARTAAMAMALVVVAAACSGGGGGGSSDADRADDAATTSTTNPAEVASTTLDLRPLSVSTDGRTRIVDDRGREVRLRGTNLNVLADYYQADPDLPPVQPATDADWDAMAANGFSVVRLLVNWSALEPSRGQLDGFYVGKIRAAIDAAKARGIYTVIDMHQDAWGKSIATPASTVCPAGTERAIGWDGAPDWATSTAGTSTCRPPGDREGADAVRVAFARFYGNDDGIRTAYVAAVAALAREFAAEPALAGIDLFNEPNQVAPAEESAAQITALYGEMIPAIRDAETQTEGGFPHLLFVEPLITFPLPGSMPAKDVSDDPNLVFAPHNYAEVIGPKILSVEDTFSVQADTATDRGWPLWVGEYGVYQTDDAALSILKRFAAAEDAHLASGSAAWQWRQRCGDPHTIGTPGNRPTGPVIQLNLVQCPDDTDAGPNEPFLAVVGRAYPGPRPARCSRCRPIPTRGRSSSPARRRRSPTRTARWWCGCPTGCRHSATSPARAWPASPWPRSTEDRSSPPRPRAAAIGWRSPALIGRRRRFEQPQAAGGDRRLGARELHGELGAVGREHVVPDEHGRAGHVGGDAPAHEHGRPDRHAEQLGVERAGGVGPDGLGGPAEAHRQEVVEGLLLHLAEAELAAETLGAPHRDAGEGLAVGQVDPAHGEDLVDAQDGPHLGRRGHEGEVGDAPFRAQALGLQLGLDGGQPGEGLADGGLGHEPAEPLPRVDEALGAELLERLADRHPGGAVRCRQLGLGREQAAGGVLARPQAPSQVDGDLLVPDGAHLSHSCMLCSWAQAPVLARFPTPTAEVIPWP
ncbi:MAG: cellulase family glycosylhydrolase [Acidimicrobiales bacterium]